MRFLTAELMWFRKLVNPPYSVIDIFTVIGLLFILLTIPVITLNLNETRNPVSQAANAPCSENLSYEVIGIGSSNTLKVDQGQNVSVKATGLSGCTNSDKVTVRLWGFDNAPWQGWKVQKQCQLGSNSTSCTMTFPAPNTPDVGYPIQVTYDKDADGKNDGWTGWPKWLGVNKASASCTSKPTLSMSKTSGIEPKEIITANVGGFSNCNGDKFEIQVQKSNENTWWPKGSCLPSTTKTTCSISITILRSGTFLVRVAYDQGNNGSVEKYSSEVLVQVAEKVVQKCSGTPRISSVNPNPVDPGQKIKLTGSGLSNCSSADKLMFSVWDWDKMQYTSHYNCGLSNGSSCFVEFSAPTRADKYTVKLFLDKAVGANVKASPLFKDFNVSKSLTCSGSPSLSFSSQSVEPGGQVGVTVSGLSNCNSTDWVSFWIYLNNQWQHRGSCNLSNGSSCSTQFTAPSTAGSYWVTPLIFGKQDNKQFTVSSNTGGGGGGGDGSLGVEIPVRNSNVKIINSSPASSAPTWAYNQVVSESKNNGWNPAMLVTVWKNESGYSTAASGDITPWSLGCLDGSSRGITAQLSCFFKTHSPRTNFTNFVSWHCGPNQTVICSNNPVTVGNYFYVYNDLVPRGNYGASTGTLNDPWETWYKQAHGL